MHFVKLVLILAFTPILVSQTDFPEVLEIQDKTLPRGIETKTQFTVDVLIDDINPSEYNESYDYAAQVGIIIKKASSRELSRSTDSAGDVDEIGFVIDNAEVFDQGDNSKLNKFVVVRVTIREGTKKLSEIIEKTDGENKIVIEAVYSNAKDEDFTTGDVDLVESVKLVDNAPGGFSITGAFKSLLINWNSDETVTLRTGTEDADTSTGSASDTVAVIFQSSADNLELPTYTFKPDADADEEGTACRIDYSLVDGATSCVVCDDNDGADKIYLNFEKISELSELTVKRIGTGGVSKVEGFEPDETYAAFLYYNPDGLARTACLTAVPTLNLTWAEFNGESVAEADDPKCFIATAAYGTESDHRLNILRSFRDTKLLSNEIGENFVALYYAISPIAAELIRNNPFVKKIVQALLPAFVFTASGVQGLGWPLFLALATLLMALAIATPCLVWQRLQGKI